MSRRPYIIEEDPVQSMRELTLHLKGSAYTVRQTEHQDMRYKSCTMPMPPIRLRGLARRNSTWCGLWKFSLPTPSILFFYIIIPGAKLEGFLIKNIAAGRKLWRQPFVTWWVTWRMTSSPVPATGSAAGWRRRLKSMLYSSSRCILKKAGGFKNIFKNIGLIYFGISRQ